MQFQILGPPRVLADGLPVPLGSRKQRALLAVLISRAGAQLPVDDLVEALWNGTPPRSARENLRTYVHRLRAVLGPELVVGGGVGYGLMASPEQIDSAQFIDAVTRGRAAITAGDLRAGRDTTDRGLRMWRGPAYDGFHDVAVLAAEDGRLQRYRMLAVEQRVQADLDLGRAVELVPELVELTAEHPFHERFCGQLMLALYRCGRQAEALAAYRRTRELLAGQLGIEPQAELAALHAAMLRGDRTLLAAGERPPADITVARPVPAQLPADVPAFTGRAPELDALTAALGATAGATGQTRIAAVSGAGGMGKTWLALRWAHQHRGQFPDGQLFVNLRGFDPAGRPMSTTSAARSFLEALGVAPGSMPNTPEAQVGLYRSLVNGRRMLILLDNARDAAQAAELLPGAIAGAVIVTSRDRLAGLVSGHGARPVPLDVLGDAEATDAFVRRLGGDRVAAERGAVSRLVGGCGGMPLAIGIAAARAVLAPELPLSVIAAEVDDAGSRLAAFDEDAAQASLSAVLSWSYASLTPEHARTLALVALVTGPDFGVSAAAALCGCPPSTVAAALHALERQSLLHRQMPGRWRLHDLIRLYAAQRAAADLDDDDRRLALRRLVEHYVSTALAADRLLNPGRTPITLTTSLTGGAAEPLLDEESALAWFTAEHANLLAAQTLAFDHGLYANAWQLAWTMSTFHRRSGLSGDEIGAWRLALAAAEHDGDLPAQADAQRSLGEACALAGHHGEAAGHLKRALELACEQGDPYNEARAHRALAVACECRGDDEQALRHAHDALRIYQHFDNPARTADALNAVGWYSARVGRHEEARDHLQAALALVRKNGNRSAEASALHSLGFAAHRSGEPADALAYYAQSLEVLGHLGHTYLEATVHEDLGQAHAAVGDRRAARRQWQRALELYETQERRDDAARIRECLVL